MEGGHVQLYTTGIPLVIVVLIVMMILVFIDGACRDGDDCGDGDNDDTQASESHPRGNLGFFAPNCHIHGIGGGESDHKKATQKNHQSLSGHSEDIFVPEIHNPNITLNAYQVISSLSFSPNYLQQNNPSSHHHHCLPSNLPVNLQH